MFDEFDESFKRHFRPELASASRKNRWASGSASPMTCSVGLGRWDLVSGTWWDLVRFGKTWWDSAVGLGGTWWDSVGLGSWTWSVGLGGGTWRWDLVGGTWWDLIVGLGSGTWEWDLVGGT